MFKSKLKDMDALAIFANPAHFCSGVICVEEQPMPTRNVNLTAEELDRFVVANVERGCSRECQPSHSGSASNSGARGPTTRSTIGRAAKHNL